MPRVFEDHVQILVLCMENSSSKILFLSIYLLAKRAGCKRPCSTYFPSYEDVTMDPTTSGRPFKLELPKTLVRVETTRAVKLKG